MPNISNGCVFITVGEQSCTVFLCEGRDFVLAEYPQGCLRPVPIAGQAEVGSLFTFLSLTVLLYETGDGLLNLEICSTRRSDNWNV